MASPIHEEPKPYLDRNRIVSAQYPELVVCSICQGVLWSPKACKNCETSYCSSCIKARQLETSRSFQCPIDCPGFVEDRCPRVMFYILSRLEVQCRYTPNGCQEILPYNSLEIHEEVCRYRLKVCTGCGEAIIKKDFQDHENTCLWVSLTCQECDTTFQRQDKDNHTDITCLRIQLRQQKEKLNQLERLVKHLMREKHINSLTEIMGQLKEETPPYQLVASPFTSSSSSVDTVSLNKLTISKTNQPNHQAASAQSHELIPTTTLLSSPPEHKNTTLEQMINKNKDKSKLDLSGEDLTDADMEIVVYYLLRDNKVSNVVFVFDCSKEREESG